MRQKGDKGLSDKERRGMKCKDRGRDVDGREGRDGDSG